MSIKGRAYVMGAFEHPTRDAPDKSTPQLHAESALGPEGRRPDLGRRGRLLLRRRRAGLRAPVDDRLHGP
ncbi:hypothetical protein [Phenylobacterium sp. J367]|uniref:hypothetical protein n=1 Tax=Phenylobacterium sp. J367 TaxID=2898435 RepID=UPI002151AA3F|nr:hypothetical protein [Phenylobacterium sp. J367]MCR5877923.1 hypothetical protein [Phenylobacterium sp. J367]